MFGRTLRQLDSDNLDVTLWLTDDDAEDCGLRAPLDHCAIVPADPRTRGLDPDERILVGLHRMMLGLVNQIARADDRALTVVNNADHGVYFAAEWPDNEDSGQLGGYGHSARLYWRR